jgi:uncharacterized protein YcbK (DUF882 family)
MRRISLLLIAALCMSAPAFAGSEKATADSTTSTPAKKSVKKKKKRVAAFNGHNAAKSSLRTEPLAKPSGDVWLFAENLNEEVRVNIYKPDGNFDDAALAKLDELFRCARTGAVRAVRAELYEQLSRFFDHFEGKRIDLVSGFRFAERNSSRHFHASAMDIRIKGVSINEMYRYAESLDGGGMGVGIYPVSGFVHVDFRAPGEPSYRRTDTTGPNSGGSSKGKKKKPSHRTQPARKPTS